MWRAKNLAKSGCWPVSMRTGSAGPPTCSSNCCPPCAALPQARHSMTMSRRSCCATRLSNVRQPSVEALDRVLLFVECLEDVAQLRDRQQIVHLLGHVHELHLAAVPGDRRISGDQFAKACAVHVAHATQIDQNLPVSLVDHAVDLVLELRVALAQGDLARDIQHFDVPYRAFFDLHAGLLRRKWSGRWL